MLGNVMEWTFDGHHKYPRRRAVDPVTMHGRTRVLRGGAWASKLDDLRHATRADADLRGRDATLGFRPVRTVK